MKIAATATAAATLLLLPGTISAFAPAAPAARPSAPSATSSSSSSLAAIDPSTASDAVSSSSPDLLIPAAGAAIAALGVAIATTLGKSKKGDAAKGAAAPAAKKVEPEIIDVSIPYDAPAALAFQSLTKKDAVVDYDQFKSLYEAKMVAEVKAKVQSSKIVEVEKVLKGMESEVGDIQKEIDALFGPPSAEVEESVTTTSATASAATAAASSTPAAAAQDVDLSIPYDAAAKLAYESSDKSLDYDAFKTKYEAEAVELVVAKKKAREQQQK